MSLKYWSALKRRKRRATVFVLGLLTSLFCGSAIAQKQTESSVKTLSPTEGDREAQELIARIRSQRPEQTYTNAVLKVRDREGGERKIAVQFRVAVTDTNWTTRYDASPSPAGGPNIWHVSIIHGPNQATSYLSGDSSTMVKDENASFASSDFSLADLGLEFLQWPKQRVTKKEMYSSRYCAVLESTNPNPTKGGYARVRSWITTEPPLAPVRAEAYDSAGKRIKVFDVKGVEKVNGHFQVDSVEMRNLQTGSRTVMEFDLGAQ
jgi:hypothetical protein